MLSKTISHESLTHFLLVSPYLMLVLKIEKVNGPVPSITYPQVQEQEKTSRNKTFRFTLPEPRNLNFLQQNNITAPMATLYEVFAREQLRKVLMQASASSLLHMPLRDGGA